MSVTKVPRYFDQRTASLNDLPEGFFLEVRWKFLTAVLSCFYAQFIAGRYLLDPGEVREYGHAGRVGVEALVGALKALGTPAGQHLCLC